MATSWAIFLKILASTAESSVRETLAKMAT